MGGRWLSPRVVLLIAVATGSCGGVARNDLIAQADGICSQANERLRALGPLPHIDIAYASAAQMPAAAGYLDRVVPIFREEGARLHGLGDPDDDAGDVNDMLMFLDRFVGRLEEARLDAHRGDSRRFTPDLLRGLGDGVQAQGAAGEFGFRVCGKLPDLQG